jgi:hypothetical protein
MRKSIELYLRTSVAHRRPSSREELLESEDDPAPRETDRSGRTGLIVRFVAQSSTR